MKIRHHKGADMSKRPHSRGMNKQSVVDFPASKMVEAQASEWLAKLDADVPSEPVLREFKAWVNASREHRQAFESLLDFWDDMNILTQVVPPRGEIASPDLSRAEPRPFWSGARLAACLATLLLLVLSAFWLRPEQQGPVIYATRVGEQREVELPDRTKVFLNTNTRLEVSYGDSKRQIKLARGEAYFEVFHNPARPFEVVAGKRLVRAIGTAFTVHVRQVDVEVIVTEGVVEIDRTEPVSLNIRVANPQASSPQAAENSAAGLNAAVLVKAGNMASYDRQTLDQIKLVVAQRLEEDLSWRQGMLLFSGEPLEQVVAEISRYTALKIIIPESKVRELQIGGFFKIGDTGALFEALREGFGIHADRVSDNMVLLISAENR